jgi:hypothetical protein
MNESVASLFLFFLRISKMNLEFRSQNKAPERQTRHNGTRTRRLFFFWYNAVTFAWQTQQKPAPPSRDSARRGFTESATLVLPIGTIMSLPIALAVALGEAAVLALTSAEQSPSE